MTQGQRSGAVDCTFLTKFRPFLQRWQSAWQTSCVRCWVCSRVTPPPSTSRLPTWRRTSPACPCRRTTHWTSCAASRSHTCDSWSSASKASGWRQRRTPMMWRQTRGKNLLQDFWIQESKLSVLSWSPARSADMCACVLFSSVFVWEWGAFWKRTNSDWNSIPELSGETSPNYPASADLARMSCVISSVIQSTNHNSLEDCFVFFLLWPAPARRAVFLPSTLLTPFWVLSLRFILKGSRQTGNSNAPIFFSPKNPHPIAESDHVCLWNIASHCLFDANAILGVAQHGSVVKQFVNKMIECWIQAVTEHATHQVLTSEELFL